MNGNWLEFKDVFQLMSGLSIASVQSLYLIFLQAEKNPYYVAKAYLKNQPVTIFQEKTTAPEEEEGDAELQPLYKVAKKH